MISAVYFGIENFDTNELRIQKYKRYTKQNIRIKKNYNKTKLTSLKSASNPICLILPTKNMKQLLQVLQTYFVNK